VLKTDLVAFRPDVGHWPFCVIDRDGFNHLPHTRTSVFGTTRWQTVRKAADRSINPQEIELIWQEIKRFLPAVNRSSVADLREWAGTAAQMMHIDQIIPGAAPVPSVIDHSQEPPRGENLWSVSPGRATLWARAAEEASQRILNSLGDGPITTTRPPWALSQ
jgi:glycerol-3-phosphate dehydrogenase